MIHFGDPLHARMIATEAGVTFNPACDAVISRTKSDGTLLGGSIFTDFTGASIAIHVASFAPLWINPDLLWVTFHYPFVQLGVKKLFGPVPATNTTALEFDLKLGFKEEARISDVFPDGDLILLSMQREDCRWLNIKPRTLGNRGP